MKKKLNALLAAKCSRLSLAQCPAGSIIGMAIHHGYKIANLYSVFVGDTWERGTHAEWDASLRRIAETRGCMSCEWSAEWNAERSASYLLHKPENICAHHPPRYQVSVFLVKSQQSMRETGAVSHRSGTTVLSAPQPGAVELGVLRGYWGRGLGEKDSHFYLRFTGFIYFYFIYSFLHEETL